MFEDTVKNANLGDNERIVKNEVHNKKEFLNALRNLPEDTDDVVIFVHGYPDHLEVGGERIDSTDLAGVKLPKNVQIDEMALLSCNTAKGWQKDNSIAQDIYSYFKPDTLIAPDSVVDVLGSRDPGETLWHRSFDSGKGAWVAVYSPEGNYSLPVTRSLGPRMYNFKTILDDAEAISGHKDRREGVLI